MTAELRSPKRPRQAPDPLGSFIGFQLRRAQLVTFAEMIAALEALDLRPAQFAMLRVLEANPGVTQAKAALLLVVKRANFVAMMDEFEARGLAERRRSESDRRGHALYLTEKGQATIDEANRIAAGLEATLVARLGGPEERDRFLAMLGRIIG